MNFDMEFRFSAGEGDDQHISDDMFVSVDLPDYIIDALQGPKHEVLTGIVMHRLTADLKGEVEEHIRRWLKGLADGTQ